MKRSALLALSFFSLSVFANPCEIPFLNQKLTNPSTGNSFEAADVYNTNPKLQPIYRMRYVVADLNTKDDSGQCKGIQEFYPEVPDTTKFPDMKDPIEHSYFVNNVGKYYKPPQSRSPVSNGYCVGQTISLCEMASSKTQTRDPKNKGRMIESVTYSPVEVARFATSAAIGGENGPAPERTYYPQKMMFHSRHWDNRAYTTEDAARDSRLGGVKSGIDSGKLIATYHGGLMPNFMGITAASGFQAMEANGAHEISSGESLPANMGAPASHGCLRLSRYAAIFMRWWLPLDAALFIHYTPSGYTRTP